jgi:deoxyribonuclease V
MKPLLENYLRICSSHDYRDATKFQNEIAELIPGKNRKQKTTTVCALDISYNKFSAEIYAAATLLSFPGLEPLEETAITDRSDFPYLPGLLAFREGPTMIKAVHSLARPIDLLLVDGHGMAHPRGAGIASILGLLLDKPSIGCAKSRLVGEFKAPGPKKGAKSNLTYEGDIVGSVVRTRDNVKPLFISVGYGVDLDCAVSLVLEMCVKTRMPEPLRLAHSLANLTRQNQALQRSTRASLSSCSPGNLKA